MTVLYMAPTVIKGMQDGDGSLSDSARRFTTWNDYFDSPNSIFGLIRSWIVLWMEILLENCFWKHFDRIIKARLFYGIPVLSMNFKIRDIAYHQ